MEKPLKNQLPADLPEDWKPYDILTPDGTDAELTEQHGYNYLMKQVNNAQDAVNKINDIFDEFSEVATTGSYNDLSDKPEIPILPDNIVTDADYIHTDNNYTAAEKSKLLDIETGAQKNVIETITLNGVKLNSTNKTVNISIDTENGEGGGASQVQADWEETDTGSTSYIQNKPKLAKVATSGSYNDLSDKPANNGGNGAPGKSPYIGENGNWYVWSDDSEVFVDTGTRAQGEAGDTPKKGVDYFDGASAYEIWLSEGNTGTEQDYLDSQKGERGITPTITVSETVTGEADSKAVVENIGTDSAVKLKFTIPQGRTPVKGIDYFDGEKGGKGDTGAKGADAVLRIKATSDFTAAELPNGAWGGVY